jgi:hypothetical protein
MKHYSDPDVFALDDLNDSIIREIKSAIDGNTRSIETLNRTDDTLAKATESNAKTLSTHERAD